MPVLDFTEIPEAHVANGLQDTFELFARDFLEFLGFRVVSVPDRGADGGKDIIVEETRTGVGGETIVRWLVSCKHKSTSNKSVTPTDEANITDRVHSNKCCAFLGFYSTLPSAGLNNNLEGLKIERTIYDRERIASHLLRSSEGLKIAKRYFPKSLNRWKIDKPEPAEIFADRSVLECHVCGKNLLEEEDKGIISLWTRMGNLSDSAPNFYECTHWTCRGHCDEVLARRQRHQDLIDKWDDVGDVMIPTIYVKWIISIINAQRAGVTYSDEAFDSLKQFLLTLFPYISRHLSDKEKSRIKTLTDIPAWLGGIGY